MSAKLTTPEFVERARKVHGERYDYSLVDYRSSQTKVTIICPNHGQFEQIPNKHLSGAHCRRCAHLRLGSKRRKTNAQFIAEAQEIHGDRYDYSNVHYQNGGTKITIKCLEHGLFKQTPNGHLQGNGCYMCKAGGRLSTEQFKYKARARHGVLYDYSMVDYHNNATKVKIICQAHGVFDQTPVSHLQGRGCPTCGGKIRKTTKQFVAEAKQVHGDLFDYSCADYLTARIRSR